MSHKKNNQLSKEGRTKGRINPRDVANCKEKKKMRFFFTQKKINKKKLTALGILCFFL